MKYHSFLKTTQVIIAVLLILAIIWWVRVQFGKPSLKTDLVHYVDTQNKLMPQVFEHNSQIDSVRVVFSPIRSLVFYCTLLDTIELEKRDILKNYFEPRLTQYVQEAPELRYFKQRKVQFTYIYRDLKADSLFVCYIGVRKYQ